MASGADADDRLARGNVLAERVEIDLGWQAAAGADQHDIRLANGVGHARKTVLVLRIGVYDRDVEAQGLKFLFGKRRQRRARLIFVVANEHRDVSPVATEVKRLS